MDSLVKLVIIQSIHCCILYFIFYKVKSLKLYYKEKGCLTKNLDSEPDLIHDADVCNECLDVVTIFKVSPTIP